MPQLVTNMPNNIYLVPDDIYSAFVKLYLDCAFGHITVEERDREADRLVEEGKDMIAVIKNVEVPHD